MPGLPRPNGARLASSAQRSSVRSPPWTSASDLRGRAQVVLAEREVADRREGLGEGLDVLRLDRETRRRRVPAPALEVARALAQPVVEIEARDRAPRALPVAVGAGDQHDRPVVALDEPRGDDADHALVPAGAGDHVGAATPALLGPLLDRLDGLPQDPLLDGLPVAIQVLELGGELLRGLTLLRQQELERGFGPAEPSGGVQARREPEADRTGVDRGRIHARRAHQLLEAGLLRARQLPQPGDGQAAVLVQERHDVGDGGDRDEVEVPQERLRARPEQRLSELPDDPGAAELRERVLAAVGPDDRAIRQFRP